jgi:hypothetical protein
VQDPMGRLYLVFRAGNIAGGFHDKVQDAYLSSYERLSLFS